MSVQQNLHFIVISMCEINIPTKEEFMVIYLECEKDNGQTYFNHIILQKYNKKDNPGIEHCQ